MRPLFQALFGLLVVSISATAQGSCAPSVQSALNTLGQNCTQVGRNQVCYGNDLITAAGRNPDFAFANVGNLVSVGAVETLQLSPYNLDDNVWGLALFNLQANIPDSLPGQGVTLLAFGDTTLKNGVAPDTTLKAHVKGDTPINRVPDSTQEDVITTLISDSNVLADGRSEDGHWVRVQLDLSGLGEHPVGWILSQALDVEGDINELSVLSATAGHQTPMQAFTLKTGVGKTDCADVPPDGILVQSPSGALRVSFTVNGVLVGMGSTAFIQAVDQSLLFTLLEGTAFVDANGITQVVPAATQVLVPLNADLTAPTGAPTMPVPAPEETLEAMRRLLSTIPPTSDASEFAGLREVVVADSVAQSEIETAIATTTKSIALLSGRWQLVVTDTQTLRDEWGPQFDIDYCQELVFHVHPIGDTRTTYVEDFNNYGIYNDGIYGNALSDHEALQVKEVPIGTAESAFSLQVMSPTRAISLDTYNRHHDPEGYAGNPTSGTSVCETTTEWTWLGN